MGPQDALYARRFLVEYAGYDEGAAAPDRLGIDLGMFAVDAGAAAPSS